MRDADYSEARLMTTSLARSVVCGGGGGGGVGVGVGVGGGGGG